MTRLTGEYFTYTTMAGDRWDLLAWRYYGDQHLQTVLLEANRQLILDGLSVPLLILPQGVELKIPVIAEEAASESLPPWKRNNPDYGAA